MLNKKSIFLQDCLSVIYELIDVAPFNTPEEEYLSVHFADWLNLLVLKYINIKGQGYLLSYLPSQVERQVSCTWKYSPYKGWMLSSLAQALCLVQVRKQIGRQFCLPLPVLTPELSSTLEQYGIPCAESIKLQFSIFTFYPILQNCTLCALVKSCPKRLEFNESNTC